MTAAGPAPIGVITHYNLLERLDPSGPGELFRARDTRVGRTVTIRLLPAGYAADPAERERFFAAAKSVIALSHPNVTTLYEAGEHDSRLFLAFEFMKGQPLRAEMAGRPMNVRRAVELAIQVADGIAEAHGAGFIHGGLSPETVIITAKGHAKIPAFELAARTGFEQTNGGVRLHDYDSPEEARGQTADDRSDIYSVGAVLYEMLTTRRPMHKGAAAPSASNPHVVKELDDVVLRAVAPNPDSRIQSAAALAAELRSVAAILDARGGGGDEDEPAAASTSVGKVLLVALAMLAALALIIYLAV
jgi:eukaryotic-like serine/threonine-protein kinase